jgi:hypothetical protein
LITKTLTKTAIGMVSAAALIAPGAMAIAPQVSNMACQYPNSVPSKTVATGARQVERGETVKISVSVTADAGDPNGDVRLLLVGPDRGDKNNDPDVYYNSGYVPLPNDAQKGFHVRKNIPVGSYTAKAKFRGSCKFMNSSDRFNFEVTRKG